MKTLIFIAALTLQFTLFGQINFKTGNVELEASLNQVNVEAKADLSAFKTSLKLDFGIAQKEVDQLFSLKIEPAEVQLACSISNITKKPISTVIESCKKNKGQGWGVIAKDLGIKPGSAEFHELKGKNKPKGKGKSNGHSNGNGQGNGKGKK
ncbi:MAG: hypothetical protein KDC84_07590 [Crocinitomicaceae bacterium]|nr:hypothetical protein [Crocinitomicaceae bacterium]